MTGAVHHPSTVDEAARLLTEHPTADLIAGGTDLIPAVQAGRRARPERLISLRRVADLSGVRRDGDDLVIGATTTWAQLAVDPLVELGATALADVARQLGSPATRAWATIGGSVAHRARAMDVGPVLVAFAADVELRSPSGTHRVPATSFLAGEIPGGEPFVLTALRCPVGQGASGWVKLGVRERLDTAVVSAAVVIREAGPESVGRVSAALGGIDATARRLDAFERQISGRSPTDAVNAAASIGPELGPVLGDWRVPADYRRQVAGTVLGRALTLAHRRSQEALRP